MSGGQARRGGREAANVALVTPLAEELLFRGVIEPKLGQIMKVKDALIVQAALFSALHLSPVIRVTHFILGLALGGLRRRSRSLLPGILLRGAWNAWVVWSSG
jgi:membrane protease YdiL (CAAX protease family)